VKLWTLSAALLCLATSFTTRLHRYLQPAERFSLHHRPNRVRSLHVHVCWRLPFGPRVIAAAASCKIGQFIRKKARREPRKGRRPRWRPYLIVLSPPCRRCFADLTNPFIYILFALVGFAVIGFIDDDVTLQAAATWVSPRKEDLFPGIRQFSGGRVASLLTTHSAYSYAVDESSSEALFAPLSIHSFHPSRISSAWLSFRFLVFVCVVIVRSSTARSISLTAGRSRHRLWSSLQAPSRC